MPTTPRRRQRARPGTCVYCGQQTTVEDDHVVPRALWPEDERQRVQYVVVPACRDCNVLKSKGEDDLRDYAVIDLHGGEHSYAQRLTRKVARSIAKGHSNIGKAVLTAELTPLLTKHGIYLGDYPSAPIYSTNMMQTLRMIVRGLYFIDTGSILPIETPVEVWVIPNYSVPAVFGPLGNYPHPGARILGDNVFFWVPFIPADAPTSSLWPMGIYDSVFFVGATGSPVRNRQAPRTDSVAEKRGRRRIIQLLGPWLVERPPVDWQMAALPSPVVKKQPRC